MMLTKIVMLSLIATALALPINITLAPSQGRKLDGWPTPAQVAQSRLIEDVNACQADLMTCSSRLNNQVSNDIVVLEEPRCDTCSTLETISTSLDAMMAGMQTAGTLANFIDGDEDTSFDMVVTSMLDTAAIMASTTGPKGAAVGGLLATVSTTIRFFTSLFGGGQQQGSPLPPPPVPLTGAQFSSIVKSDMRQVLEEQQSTEMITKLDSWTDLLQTHYLLIADKINAYSTLTKDQLRGVGSEGSSPAEHLFDPNVGITARVQRDLCRTSDGVPFFMNEINNQIKEIAQRMTYNFFFTDQCDADLSESARESYGDPQGVGYFDGSLDLACSDDPYVYQRGFGLYTQVKRRGSDWCQDKRAQQAEYRSQLLALRALTDGYGQLYMKLAMLDATLRQAYIDWRAAGVAFTISERLALDSFRTACRLEENLFEFAELRTKLEDLSCACWRDDSEANAYDLASQYDHRIDPELWHGFVRGRRVPAGTSFPKLFVPWASEVIVNATMPGSVNNMMATRQHTTQQQVAVSYVGPNEDMQTEQYRTTTSDFLGRPFSTTPKRFTCSSDPTLELQSRGLTKCWLDITLIDGQWGLSLDGHCNVKYGSQDCARPQCRAALESYALAFKSPPMWPPMPRSPPARSPPPPSPSPASAPPAVSPSLPVGSPSPPPPSPASAPSTLSEIVHMLQVLLGHFGIDTPPRPPPSTPTPLPPSPPPPSPTSSLCPGKSFPSAGVDFGEKGVLTADNGGCDKWVEWAPWWNQACDKEWRGADAAGNELAWFEICSICNKCSAP